MTGTPGDFGDDSQETVGVPLPTIGRYKLVRELGAGGMGRVFLAHDQDLNEPVALKLIRPEYSSPEAEERFKREITVARRITHPNVIRIHDTGTANGERFISMAFVDGEDLATIIRRGTLPRATAIDIIAQICDGLNSAHKAGVVHRDLKPGNIMVGRDGHAYLMDFGLAHAVEVSQISVPGSILGTVDYMSPEQARGEPADQRSDIFAVGVILFELLAGTLPFDGETPTSRLSARLHREAPDLLSVRPEVPPALNDVIRRCLAQDRHARFHSADELRQALLAVASQPRASSWLRRPPVALAASALVALAVAAFVGMRAWLSVPKPANSPPIKVAVLPLRNASGDSSTDWFGGAVSSVVLARMTEISGVQPMTVARLASVLDPRVVDKRSPDDLVSRVREFTNADAVLAGQYIVEGNRLRVDGVVRLAGRADVVSLPTQSASLDQIDLVAGALADALSRSLGRPQPRPLRPATERSATVTRLYHEGVELSAQGKHLDAVRRLVEATNGDDTFAEAWGALAGAYVALRQDRDAQSAVRKAAGLSATLPPRDRFRILALQATIQHDNTQAIAAYEEWLKAVPEDSDARLRLAELYESTGNYPSSRQRFAELVERDPLYVEALLGSGRVAIRSGAPADAIDPLTRALALAVRLDNDVQKAATHQALGVAFKRLNRPVDALASYQQALELRQRLGLKAATASSFGELAQIHELLGHLADAERYYLEGLKVQREVGNRSGEATALINLSGFYLDGGDPRKSLRMVNDALRIARENGNEDQEALCLNNIGNAYLELGELQNATVFLERSLAIRRRLDLQDTLADTLHNLGVVAANGGDYTTAKRLVTEALESRRQGKNERGLAYAHYELGLIHRGQGRFLASSTALGDAERTVRAGEDPWYPEIVARHIAGRATLGECTDLAARFERPLDLTRRSWRPQNLPR
jgi:tetratricopeptide (TPR) repeat protein/predicted Ser/Thr protein kinase